MTALTPPIIPFCGGRLAKEIDSKEVKNYTAEDEICKCSKEVISDEGIFEGVPLWRDFWEFSSVSFIDLTSQTRYHQPLS